MILLAATAVVLFWRGIWGLLDHFLFPENPLLSYLISALVGLLILWLDDYELHELGINLK